MITTQNKMYKAGTLLDGMSFTDSDIKLVISSLKLIISFMEGAGYSKRVIGPLRLELLKFESYKQGRKMP